MAGQNNPPEGCVDCNKLNYGFDIRLVDEQNNPLAGVAYRLTVGDIERSGSTDANGQLLEHQLKPGHATLVLDSQPLLSVLSEPQRLLRSDRHPDNSPVKQQARQQQRRYHYCRIGDLVADIPAIENWQHAKPPQWHFPDPKPNGKQIDYYPTADKVARWTLEVCPFRAWVPMLTHSKQYDLINAYNLSLMSILAYAGGKTDEHGSALGSVNYFFERALLDLSQIPAKINDQILPCLVVDVPFNQRFYQYEFIDSSSEPYEIGDTQFFYAISPNQALISWRGTAGISDVLTDVQGVQVDSAPIIGGGVMHQGFKEAYLLENNENFLNKLSSIEKLVSGKEFFLSGHSLGGALALINSVKWQRYNPILYTYGMPRVFSREVVKQLDAISHFRHINEEDYVTTLPGKWLKVQPLQNKHALLLPQPFSFWAEAVKASWYAAKADSYRHHGTVVHLITADSALIGKTSKRNDIRVINRGDYAALMFAQAEENQAIAALTRELRSLKVMVSPASIGYNSETFVKRVWGDNQTTPHNENPQTVGANPISMKYHSSSLYARYLYQRLHGYLAEQHLDHYGREKQRLAERVQNNYLQKIDDEYLNVVLAVLKVDDLLIQSLQVADHPVARNGIGRFIRAQGQLPALTAQAKAMLNNEYADNQEKKLAHPVYRYETMIKRYSSRSREELAFMHKHGELDDWPAKPNKQQYEEYRELTKLLDKQRNGLEKI